MRPHCVISSRKPVIVCGGGCGGYFSLARISNRPLAEVSGRNLTPGSCVLDIASAGPGPRPERGCHKKTILQLAPSKSRSSFSKQCGRRLPKTARDGTTIFVREDEWEASPALSERMKINRKHFALLLKRKKEHLVLWSCSQLSYFQA